MINRKRIVVQIFILLLAQSLFCETKALLIGIAEYPSSSGWGALASDTDLSYVRDGLLFSGVDARNIEFLKDEEATYNGIIRGLERLSLRSKPGDHVWIHFSGHGQQIKDEDGDEVDGLDEALIPYDAHKTFKSDVYEGEYHLRDDIIRQYSFQLRQQLGPEGRLIWTFDACHSGTGARSRGTLRRQRGTADPFATAVEYRGTEERVGIDIYEESGGLAPMAAYSASAAHQSNYEMTTPHGKQAGTLSYCLYRVLSKHGFELTFEELFERLAIEMKIYKSYQDPQWEGSSGITIAGAPRMSDGLIDVTMRNGQLVLEQGFLQNITVGTKVEVISIDRKTSLGAAFVQKIDPARSVLALEKDNGDLSKELLKAKIISYAPPAPRITVLDESGDFQEVLGAIKYVTPINQNPQLVIRKFDGGYNLADMDGVELDRSSTKEDFSSRLPGALVQYTKAKYIREYDRPSDLYVPEIYFVDVHGQKYKNGFVGAKDKPYNICIKNNGQRPFYFGVVEVDSDYSIGSLSPKQSEMATDNYLKKGEVRNLFKRPMSSDTEGTIVLKLMVQNKPVSWVKSIGAPNSTNATRGASDPFDTVFEVTGTNNARSTTPLKALDALSVYTFLVTLE